jgi:hypothetical protein
MNSENELSNSVELAKKLIKKREEVKRKMNLLKQGEIRQEGAFSPITKRLKTISDQLQNTDVKSYNNNTNKNDNHNKKNQNLMKQEIVPINSLILFYMKLHHKEWKIICLLKFLS